MASTDPGHISDAHALIRETARSDLKGQRRGALTNAAANDFRCRRVSNRCLHTALDAECTVCPVMGEHARTPAT